MNHKNRVAVISGASGGLGKVVTQVFAAEGMRLALLGRSIERLNDLVKALGIPEDQVLPIAVDLSDLEAAQQTARAVIEKFGRLDILVNLLGGWIGGKSVIETSTDEIENMLQQHILSSHVMLKAFVPPMRKQEWGRVLAISSPNATHPPGNNAPYAIGKAGMEALLISLAQELRGSGVTANVLQVNTIDVKHERLRNPSRKNRAWTTPEEITATLLHLCSEEAAMINGARIPVYGSP